MPDLINGRTPEQIKRALACVNQDIDACVECPYETMNCSLESNIDALALIAQLEAERDAALAKQYSFDVDFGIEATNT